MNPLRHFAHRHSCMDFRTWLWAWWDSAPWRIPPRDSYYRCIMGGPVDDSVRCHRRIESDMLCKKHGRTVAS